MKMKGTIEEIVSTFPWIGETAPTQNGFNFVIEGKTFSFYYNEKSTRRNVIVYKNDTEYFKPGAEVDALALIHKRHQTKAPVADAPLKDGVLDCIRLTEGRIERLESDTQRKNIRLINYLKELVVQFKELK